MKKFYFLLPCLILFICCHKNNNTNWHYYEVGTKTTDSNWRDTSFIVATSNPHLIRDVNAELQRSIGQRRIVLGNLRPGSGVDRHLQYWIDTVGRFSPWNSYSKKEVNPDYDETSH